MKLKQADQAWYALAMKPHEHFSRSICEKFPEQYKRWIRCSQNVAWMLRNKPISPFSNNQKAELIAVANLKGR